MKKLLLALLITQQTFASDNNKKEEEKSCSPKSIFTKEDKNFDLFYKNNKRLQEIAKEIKKRIQDKKNKQRILFLTPKDK